MRPKACTLRNSLSLVISLLAFAPLVAAQTKPRDLDIRSGERGLHELLGTRELGPIRRRAAEIGGREIVRERQFIQTLKKEGRSLRAAGPEWKSIGPVYRPKRNGTVANAGDDSGLASQVAIHPTSPNIIYLATSGGGVWKSTDTGQSWNPTMDAVGQLPIGAVAIAKSNPNRIYAATGNADTSSSPTQNAPGIGILVSDDAGASWRVSPSGTQAGNKFFDIDVDPRNAEIVLTASDKGLYRTEDGGNSWVAVLSTQTVSIARSESTPDVVFAGTWFEGTAALSRTDWKFGMVWKSTDGGRTFVQKLNGLPGDAATRGRPEVAVAPSSPDRVFALFAKGTGGTTLDMARTDNGGDNWTQLDIMTKGVDILSSQGDTMTALAVDPENPAIAYAAGLDAWKTTDAGASWNQLSVWHSVNSSVPYLHADHHHIVISPDKSVYFATDGGLARTTDGGASFSSLNRGLITMQFYSICQSPTNELIVMGGAQDNGSSLRAEETRWNEIYGGDGFGCLVHPNNPLILHASYYGQNIVRSTDGGKTAFRLATTGLTDAVSGDIGTNAVFATILRRHPTQPDTIYTSSLRRLWESTNNAQSWVKKNAEDLALNNIRDFSLHPTDGNYIVVGGNSGIILRSTDGGVTFQKSTSVPIDTLVAVRYDRRDTKTVLAASARPDSGRERVWISRDGGVNWLPISRSGQANGLPDMPVLAIEQDALDVDTWYAGTYVGLYRTTDGGANWARYGQGLPNVIVTAIAPLPDGSKVRIATFGRGMWEVPTTAAADPVLSVTKIGSGGGRVTSSPAGIDCGASCSASFPAGTKVKLTPASDATSNFAGWGGACSGTGVCEVTLESNQTVTAAFNKFDPVRALLLSQGRVRVSVDWTNQYSGESGVAYPIPQKDEFGYFYFSDANNPEVFVKVLDFGAGTALAFVGGLTNFYYRVTFTTVATGQSLIFEKLAGALNGFADGSSLKFAAAVPVGTVRVPDAIAAKAGEAALASDPQEIALSRGRILVTVDYRNQYSGETGRGYAIPQKDEFCFFYFSNPNNPEVFVKVLDFGNPESLLFVGGLTDFEYTVTFKNSQGQTSVFTKAPGDLSGYANASGVKF